MTATSAQSASNANSFHPESARTVLLPGSPATYANRAVLREMGLRWDPANHRWHGTTTAERVRELRERLGLEVRCFGDLEAPPKVPAAPKPAPQPRPALPPIAVTSRGQALRLHDGSRTRSEARVAYPAPSEESDEVVTPGRRFSLLEITSGLPDDSRKEDERQEERRLKYLRERVKHARAVVATTPGLAEILANDWQKATRFYGRYGITEQMYVRGVETGGPLCPSLTELNWPPISALAEVGVRTQAVLL